MIQEKEKPAALWQYVVAGLSHLGLGALGYHFYLGQDFVALGWPAIGFGAGLLAIWGLRVWWGIFAGSFVLQFFFLNPFDPLAVVFTTGEAGEILLAGYLLRRGLDWSKGYRNIRQMRRGAFVGLVAPLVGAAAAVFAVWLGPGSERIPASGFASIFIFWWLRSAIGFMMIAPLIGAWRLRPRLIFGAQPKEGILVSVFIVSLCLISFSEWLVPQPVPMWIGLLAGFTLLWSGARCGSFLTIHLSVLVLTAASFAALEQAAIFERIGAGDFRALWWMILNVCSLGAITLSILNARAIRLSSHVSSARNRLELLVRNSPLALVEWDLDFRVRVWSRKASEIFGYSEEQAIGQSGLKLLVPMEERIHVSDQWLEVVSGKQGVRTTNHNLTSSGELILCDWYGSPVYDNHGKVVGVVAMVEDVTSLEVAQRKLAESEKRFQTIAEVIPQAISYYSMDLECLYGNMAFLATHHIEENHLPIPVENLTTQEVMQRIQPYLDRVRSGQTVTFLETLSMPDGKKHNFDRALLPDIGTDEKVCGFFSVCTDITPYRVAAEQKLALETQVLQTQKLESLSLLSGKVAHEFNNRLCGILGHADMARKDISSAPMKAKESLDRAISIAREASELCRQLFVYSGFGTGEKALTQVKPLVLEMRRLLELGIPRNIRLRTKFQESVPFIRVDLAQLRQAMVNLVQNAAQAIGQDRGEIVVSVQVVPAPSCDFLESYLTRGTEMGDLVEIAINDNGEGIPEKDLRQNFEPFFTRRPGARGLGLSGVLGIIHGHSGAIAVESVIGKGTTVKLYFAPQADDASASSELKDTVESGA